MAQPTSNFAVPGKSKIGKSRLFSAFYKHLSGLPFSCTVILRIIQRNYHQDAVSWHFDVATFAIYSVGCLQIPLVDFIATPASNVMMVQMGEDLREGRP